MEVKLVAYGTMPDEATKALIEAYLKQADRLKATLVTFYSFDTALNKATEARLKAEFERDDLKLQLAETQAELERLRSEG